MTPEQLVAICTAIHHQNTAIEQIARKLGDVSLMNVVTANLKASDLITAQLIHELAPPNPAPEQKPSSLDPLIADHGDAVIDFSGA